MIDFVSSDDASQALVEIGCFAVAQKDGTQRLVLDCRPSNCYFGVPPSTRLPNAASHAEVQIPAGKTLYSAQFDLRNAFYQIGPPVCLRPYFCLPRIRAAHVGVTHCSGRLVKPHEYITPRMCVMPMGWSHALHWCQLLHARIISTALPEIPLLDDDSPITPLDQFNCIASVHVDNFGIEGVNCDLVRDAYWRAHRAIKEKGLAVHDEVELTEGLQLLGLVINGQGKGHI